MKFRFSNPPSRIFHMKTFFATIFLSTLPFTSIVAYHEIRSAHNVAEIERIHNLPVDVQMPALSEIEVEFIPAATVDVLEAEIEVEFIPAHRIR